MLISDPANFTTYISGILYAQILAFRPNSDKPWEILITDYTRNERLREKVTSDENKLALYDDQRLVMRVSPDIFETISNEHKMKTGSFLFDSSKVDTEKCRWIETSTRFCFVRLKVGLKKSLEGFVNDASLVIGHSKDFDLLWSRFYEKVVKNMVTIPIVLIKAVEGCINGEVLNELHKREASLATSPKESSEVQFGSVKQETQSETKINFEDRKDHETLFKMTLEPICQENDGGNSFSASVSSTRPKNLHNIDEPFHFVPSSEFLTQIGTNSQVYGADYHHNALPRNVTQRSMITFSQFEFEHDQSGMTSIAQLNKISPVIDGKVYRTKARIVGYFPRELRQLCTKLYRYKDDEVICSGPQFWPMKIFLSNASTGILTGGNSFNALIPKASILKFFSCKHTEQLYTQMKEKEEKLKSILNEVVTAELILENHCGITAWVWRNINLDNLLAY